MTNFLELEPPRVSEVAMKLIYNTLWQRLPKKSIVTGLWLRNFEHTALFNNCFLHILPIDKFHYFKYYLKNIVLVTPGEKALFEQASEEGRIHYSLDIEEQSRGKCTADWSVLKMLESELKLEYKKYFPITHKGIINYSYSLKEQQVIIGGLNKRFLSISN